MALVFVIVNKNARFLWPQGDEEVKAKRALVVLAELHRRKVWTDERTADAICSACLHKSPRLATFDVKSFCMEREISASTFLSLYGLKKSNYFLLLSKLLKLNKL